MVLALPVYHPASHDTTLLNAGVALDERTIERLREIGLTEVWIRYPGMEFLEPYVSPTVLAAQATVTHNIRQALDAVLLDAHAKLDYLEFRAAVSGLLERLLENPRAALFIQELVGRSQPALRHASNVCLLSVLIGLKLEGYLVFERDRLTAPNARDVSNLGVGGMLHDIGMLRLDQPALDRWNMHHDESDPAWREHVRIGYEMVTGAVSPSAAAAILHHHQKFDGSGFPARRRLDGADEPIAGSDIHVFARIIGAADQFDRLRHPAHAPGSEATAGPSIPVVRALRLLQQDPYRRWLDPMVFKGLLAVVPPYAPGTIVRLGNGRNAAVVAWHPTDPCRPDVIELGDLRKTFDARDGADAGPVIALRERQDLAVIEAEGYYVGDDNFYPVRPDEFDVDLAGKSLFNAAASAESLRKAG